MVAYNTLSCAEVCYVGVVVSSTLFTDFGKRLAHIRVALICSFVFTIIYCNALLELCLNLITCHYEVDVIDCKTCDFGTSRSCGMLLVILVLSQDGLLHSLFREILNALVLADFGFCTVFILQLYGSNVLRVGVGRGVRIGVVNIANLRSVGVVRLALTHFAS